MNSQSQRRRVDLQNNNVNLLYILSGQSETNESQEEPISTHTSSELVARWLVRLRSVDPPPRDVDRRRKKKGIRRLHALMDVGVEGDEASGREEKAREGGGGVGSISSRVVRSLMPKRSHPRRRKGMRRDSGQLGIGREWNVGGTRERLYYSYRPFREMGHRQIEPRSGEVLRCRE